MAITNNQQVSLWRSASGTADAYAGDGSPLHSMLPHDMVRGVNVMAARIEPGFSFAMDSSIGENVSLSGRGQTRWKRMDDGIISTIPGAGMAFLAQMPIVVPQGATKLWTSIGIDRFGTGGADVTGATIAVSQINLFLSGAPLTKFVNSGRWPAAPAQEMLGNFSAADLLYARRHDIAITATGTADSYSNVVDATWTDFNTNGFNGPVAWLIVGATYNGATVGEYIYLRDFSIWGEFSNSNNMITQIDDATLALCRNGNGATGRTMKMLLDALISNACRPRPVYNQWGINDHINAAGMLRQNWLDVSPASPGLKAHYLTVPSTGTPDPSQSVELAVAPFAVQDSWDPQRLFDTTNPLRYPIDSRVTTPAILNIAEIESSVVTKGKPYEVLIGSNTSNGPQLRSMCLYEDQNFAPLHFQTTLPQAPYDNWMEHGSAIIGTETSDNRIRSVRAIRDYFRRVFKARRLAFGWSGVLDTAPYDGAIHVPAGAGYVYIGDQQYGFGTSKAPGVAKPGITIPLQYAASGINTRVRVYVSVYAKQTTTGGTGTLAVYNRNDDGTTMTGPTALTHGPSITSTTFAWYGYSSPFNEATDCYFNGNATLPYDRVLLCAKSVGGGTGLDIGAWSMAVYHSTQ